MNLPKIKLSNWGNYPSVDCYAQRPEQYDQIGPFDMESIPRGLGRSYSDCALNSNGQVILMERLNRFRSFDEKTGILTAEAGTSLKEILEIFALRGWFLPITPGTKYVTLGGCIAADVHGKNHLTQGSFSRCIIEMEVITADGVRKKCSPRKSSDLFWATVGGMGLTGIISEVTLQLIPIETAYLNVNYAKAHDYEELMTIFNQQTTQFEHCVAWVDCLSKDQEFGRGIVMAGKHATLQELPSSMSDPLHIHQKRPFTVPFYLPSCAINAWTMKTFNNFYYKQMSKKPPNELVDYESFLYPLDHVLEWNKCYGKRGFVQYQCVIPTATSYQGLKTLLETIVSSDYPGCLGVIKRFGNEGPGLLSFPLPGDCLAIDFPLLNQGLFDFLNQLDRIVLEHEGRIYLAKDVRMHADTFRRMYKRLPDWQRIKTEIDPLNRFASAMSKRLKMEALHG